MVVAELYFFSIIAPILVHFSRSVSRTDFKQLSKIDEQFIFPIKGTPAQFGVMLHQFTQTLCIQTVFQILVCQILLPGSQKNTDSIPTGANPVNATLSLGNSLLSINAQILHSNGALLRKHLNGDKNLWSLWDSIRDELEKLRWFSLPDFPEEPVFKETKLAAQEKLALTEIWLTIPYIGANRDILRLRHQRLTSEQITEIKASFAEIRDTLENASFQLKRHLIDMLDVHGKLIIEEKRKAIDITCLLQQQQRSLIPTLRLSNIGGTAITACVYPKTAPYP